MGYRITAEQKAILAARYPKDGASRSLCRDLGSPAYKIRHMANRLKLHLDDDVRRKKVARAAKLMHRKLGHGYEPHARSLESLECQIRTEATKGGPYADTMIYRCLRIISEKFGDNQADKMIRKYGLSLNQKGTTT